MRTAHAGEKQRLLIRGSDGLDHECYLPLRQPQGGLRNPSSASDVASQLEMHRKRLEALRSVCLQTVSTLRHRLTGPSKGAIGHMSFVR